MNTSPNPDPIDGLTSLRDALRRFAAERDWEQFHSPKNIAIALSVEASELLEHFQWLTEEQSRSLPLEQCAAVCEGVKGNPADFSAARVSASAAVDFIVPTNSSRGQRDD